MRILQTILPSTKKDISIYYQNTRGFRSETNGFLTSSLASSADIICVTESWLNSWVHSEELFDSSKYNVLRRDRDTIPTGKKDEGGVIIAVKRVLQASDLWVSIVLSILRKVNVCCAYVPPYSSVANLDSYLNEVGDIVRNNGRDEFLVVAD
ncbi:hypothetical protein JTB14_017175 [Gonioctena quinquepunctata]|nr:hypothetical protein JTB14_017175 [Gonioctena quinquepunctata]